MDLLLLVLGIHEILSSLALQIILELLLHLPHLVNGISLLLFESLLSNLDRCLLLCLPDSLHLYLLLSLLLVLLLILQLTDHLLIVLLLQLLHLQGLSFSL